MGNKPQLSFEVAKRTEDKKYYNIYIEAISFSGCGCKEHIFREKVFNNIEEKGSLPNFIKYMNLIFENLNKIRYDYKVYIKVHIENLLENYKEKNSQIKEAFKNIDNKKGIKIACLLLEFIYSEKVNIGKDKMNNFIENINSILKNLDFLDEKQKEYIFKFLKDLFKVEEKEEEREKEIPIKDDLISRAADDEIKNLTFSNKPSNTLRNKFSLKTKKAYSTNSQYSNKIKMLEEQLKNKEKENQQLKEKINSMKKNELGNNFSEEPNGQNTSTCYPGKNRAYVC